jgi:GYF domain 2
MTETWNINVSGQTYGPYTTQQMQAFVAEGRLAAHSLVAQAGDTQFRAADEYAALARLFTPVQPAAPSLSATGKFVTAAGVENEEDIISPTFGRSNDEPRSGERGRFVVIADMKSRSISGLEEEIFNLGPAYSLMPQAWLLTSDQPINVIRNALVQKLGKMDSLFLVDATHNKAAWFNFGPESDTRIRRVWTAQHEPVAQKQAV